MHLYKNIIYIYIEKMPKKFQNISKAHNIVSEPNDALLARGQLNSRRCIKKRLSLKKDPFEKTIHMQMISDWFVK